MMLLLVVVAIASFGLGRMSVEEATEIKPVTQIKESAAIILSNEVPEVDIAETYVASVNGTKYHLPWCSGAQRMNEENKIFFESKAAAEAAGYLPAKNCKGI